MFWFFSSLKFIFSRSYRLEVLHQGANGDSFVCRKPFDWKNMEFACWKRILKDRINQKVPIVSTNLKAETLTFSTPQLWFLLLVFQSVVVSFWKPMLVKPRWFCPKRFYRKLVFKLRFLNNHRFGLFHHGVSLTNLSCTRSKTKKMHFVLCIGNVIAQKCCEKFLVSTFDSLFSTFLTCVSVSSAQLKIFYLWLTFRKKTNCFFVGRLHDTTRREEIGFKSGFFRIQTISLEVDRFYFLQEVSIRSSLPEEDLANENKLVFFSQWFFGSTKTPKQLL